MKKFVSLFLVFALLTVMLVPAFASYDGPSCSIGASSRAVPIEKTIGGACVLFSPNGFKDNLRLSADYFEITGTGKVELSNFRTIVNDTGVSVNFTITGTYPGQARILIKPDTVYDKAGIGNTTNTVPIFVDVKIFNTEGEAGYERMSDFEYLVTVIVAPFWDLLHKIGLV